MKSFAPTIAAILLLITAPAASAQSAPAGNAHPEQTFNPESPSGDGSNPFGPPPTEIASTREEKRGFAARVDLSSLRDLAVYNNGRVKILDTLARETIERATGRKNFLGYIVSVDGKVDKVGYDPLFTLLDLLIDPAYYMDKPFIHVQYLPLRRSLLDHAGVDEKSKERWMKLTRLSPGLIFPVFSTVADELGTDQEVQRGLAQIQGAFQLLERGHGILLMASPPPNSETWSHISALPSDGNIRQAFADLSTAWRARDAEGVEQAAAALAQELPQINPDSYPGERRRIEAFYNASNPFEFGAWSYCFALVTLLLAFGTGRKWLIATGIVLLAAGIAFHTFGFGARWLIAERVPIQNQFESMTGLSLGGVLIGATIMLAKRQWLFGAAASGVGFLILLAATKTGIPGSSIGREAAILNTSVLLKYHVSTVLVSYGLITLGFFVSSLFLWTHYLTRKKHSEEATVLAAKGLGLPEDTNTGRSRILGDLDRAQMTVLQLAFWTLGVGILLGAWWADHSWGRWWAFDPKETWALLTWVIYLIVIHVRIGTSRNRALITAWLSVVGFVVMLWTYFGVNLLLPGLHAYA